MRNAPLIVVLFAMVAPLAAAPPAVLTDLDREINADPAIPTPQSFIGHDMGDGGVHHADVHAYFEALAEASPYVTLTEYGRSHEDRPLIYLTATSSGNHARLDDIRRLNERVADPRLGEVNIDEVPGVAWMAYCIHGDEPSGTDAAVLLAYMLAAGRDEATKRMRDDLVIHIDPTQNPDGRERWLAQLATFQGAVPNPDHQAIGSGLWSSGRSNHYRFDLNRDWLPLAHPETRARVAVINRWNPHLLVDAHEMGSLDTYLFDPPREPLHPAMAESVMDWRTRFSADQARMFDRYGWSYYTQEWYEEWYPGYTNAWANLRGTIGLLYEQSGTETTAVTLPSGEVMTYREAVAHQLASSLANLETLQANRKAIVGAYRADREWAVTGDDEQLRGTFLLPAGQDRVRSSRLHSILVANGVECGFAETAFTVDEVTDSWGETHTDVRFDPGTLIVHSKQPLRRLLHALLDFDPRMTDAFLRKERRSIQQREGSLLYDVTSWNLPMAFGLDAAWSDASITVESRPEPPMETPADLPRAGYGYVLDGHDGHLPAALVRLFDAGCKVRVATKSFILRSFEYERGSLLLRAHENGEDLHEVIADVAAATGATFVSADTALTENGWDLGGQRFDLLHAPRVALLCQWPISSTAFGAMWHDLDYRLGLRVSLLPARSIGGADLRRYNVIVVPGAFGLERVLGDGAMATLVDWVQDGGTLIAAGSAASAFLGSDLSAVKRRRDVLDELAVFAEAVERERSAASATFDPAVVWGDEAREVEAAPDDEEPRGSVRDRDAMKRDDAWSRLFAPSGVFARGDLDERHWLTFGLGDRLPVMVSGATVLMAKHPIRTPVRLAAADQIRLSGLMWPEARERHADSAWATVERRGRGQVILFAHDPVFRGYTDGTGRLFRNAVLLGPGAGASQVIPW